MVYKSTVARRIATVLLATHGAVLWLTKASTQTYMRMTRPR